MKLYVAQHAESVPEDVDPKRPLSDSGIADARKMAHFVRLSGVKVETILHSGKLRARQTAELFSRSLLVDGKIQEHPHLNPNDSVEEFAREITQWHGDVLVVGHLPFVATLVSFLTTHSIEHPLLAFRPGSMVCLERSESGDWLVNWMLRPELI